MTLWLAVPLALVLVAVVLLLSSSIVFHLRLRKRGKDDLMELDITLLFGLVKFHYELPSIVYEGIRRGIRVKLQESGVNPATKQQNEDEKLIDKEVVDRWREIVKKALKATNGLKEWSMDTLSHVKITKLDWSTDFSLGDAAGTATAAGALWGLKCSIVGWASQWVRLERSPRLFIVPVFKDNLAFTTEVVCAGRLSITYVLYAGLLLIGRVLKAEGGLSLWKELIRGKH